MATKIKVPIEWNVELYLKNVPKERDPEWADQSIRTKIYPIFPSSGLISITDINDVKFYFAFDTIRMIKTTPIEWMGFSKKK